MYYDLLLLGAKVDVCYNSKTNILFCKGLQLEGLTVSSQDLRQIKSTSLLWNSVKFVPYTEHIQKVLFKLMICLTVIFCFNFNHYSYEII